MKETKPITISPVTSADQAEVEEIVDRVRDLAEEHRAGFHVGADDISPLEFELLILWQGAIATCERAHQQRVAAIFEAMTAQ
ncbi:MAG: hypothetical protein AB7U82_33590 [Blastocatellales bacterium]